MSEDKPDRDGGEGFLSRWSRRKQQVARGTPPEQAGSARPAPAADERPEDRGDTDARAPAAASPPALAEPELDLTKLPKLDELTADTDYTQFLARGVPEELRTAALRKAWTLDPKIRDFIEVAENQWDFNAPDGVPGFGELAPGTDLDALLAQATGRLPAPEPPPQVAMAQAEPSPAVASGGDIALQHEGEADGQPGHVDQAGAAPPDNPPSQVPAPPSNSGIPQPRPDARDEHMSRPGRRRHGGALPG